MPQKPSEKQPRNAFISQLATDLGDGPSVLYVIDRRVVSRSAPTLHPPQINAREMADTAIPHPIGHAKSAPPPALEIHFERPQDLYIDGYYIYDDDDDSYCVSLVEPFLWLLAHELRPVDLFSGAAARRNE